MCSRCQVGEGGACSEINEDGNVLGDKSRSFCPAADASAQQTEQPCCEATSYISGYGHTQPFRTGERVPGQAGAAAAKSSLCERSSLFLSLPVFARRHIPMRAVPTPCFALPVAGELFLLGERSETLAG